MQLLNRKLIRAQRYDYRSSWAYFITICTKNRVHYFGEIVDGNMVWSVLWNYCNLFISWFSRRRKLCHIAEWIVMPNHIHLILLVEEFTQVMNEPYINCRDIDTNCGNTDTNCRDALLGHPYYGIGHGNGHAKSVSPQSPQNQQSPQNLQNLNSSTPNNNYRWPTVGSIVNMLKGAITKYAKQCNIVFAWQSRYHDHIIRNACEFERIRYYIQKNPQNRTWDRFSR